MSSQKLLLVLSAGSPGSSFGLRFTGVGVGLASVAAMGVGLASPAAVGAGKASGFCGSACRPGFDAGVGLTSAATVGNGEATGAWAKISSTSAALEGELTFGTGLGTVAGLVV